MSRHGTATGYKNAHLAAAEPTRQSPLLCDSTPPDWWVEREVQKDDDLRETLLDLPATGDTRELTA